MHQGHHAQTVVPHLSLHLAPFVWSCNHCLPCGDLLEAQLNPAFSFGLVPTMSLGCTGRAARLQCFLT